MSWPAVIAEANESALIADYIVASTVVPTTPTAMVWPNVRIAASEYNETTGFFHFTRDTFFSSTANWHIHGASSKGFYADAETSADGINWTRGANSLRIATAVSEGTTVSFGFDGYFQSGRYLRFVYWATEGVSMQTETISGSTSAASRVTVAMIHGAQA